MEDKERNDDVPAVRDALMASRRVSPDVVCVSGRPGRIKPASGVALVESAWLSYQVGDIGHVIRAVRG
ncbi:hypothetical protein [Amycolatopsis tolypomycina]|uniref:hypothetical protein n=1 Tax=Amycolatopsis tolypomycina TaxID=208445 RepID=UPI00115FE61F|nr:hypothetical protein [Amycolatopsis tolypomycina]